MSRVAFLCGGQGTQGRDMFDVVASEPAARPVFEAAAAQLGRDPRDLVRDADDEALHANRVAQILCCTRSLAVFAALGIARGDALFAGYSVGEVAAWGCAGLFGTTALMQLVSTRATAMDDAEACAGGLASVSGLRRSAVQSLCEQHGLSIAIAIAGERFVVGGERASLQPFCEAAQRAGARRSVVLPVQVASHTRRLAAASETFGAALRAAELPEAMPRDIRLLSGIDGAVVYEPRVGADKLARQLSQTVEWGACLDGCRAGGAEAIFDLGPGHALAGMAAETLPDLRVRAADEFRTLDGMRTWLERN